MKPNFIQSYLLPIILIISGIILLSIASLSHIFITGFIGLFHSPYVIYNDSAKKITIITVKSNTTPLEERTSKYILTPGETGNINPDTSCLFIQNNSEESQANLGWNLENQPYEKISQDKKILKFFPAPRVRKYSLSQFVEGKNECGYKVEDVVK